MSASVKTPTKGNPPVMLCRLCHCEFTNFKEHVKSLVHLDAREVSSTPPKPAQKHKSSYDDREESVKKSKTAVDDDKNGSSKDIESEEKSGGSKELVSSEGKADTENPTAMKDGSIILSDEEEELAKGQGTDQDLNGTATTKTGENDISDNRTEEQIEIEKHASEIGKDLTKEEKVFLNKHWMCELCMHVHRLEDGSFDEHAHDECHKKDLELQLTSLRKNYTWRKNSCQWLLSCSACSFHTNDKAQFISHLQTEMHDRNVNEVIKNKKIPLSGDSPSSQNRERDRNREKEKSSQPVTSNVPQKNTNDKESSKASLVGGVVSKQNNTNSKHLNPKVQESSEKSSKVQENKSTSNITPKKPHQEKPLGSRSVPRNVKQNHPVKSNPKPLMSLSLPDSMNKSKSGWKSTTPVTRNQSSSNKPGILGEYRPDLSLNNFGFNGLNRKDPFGGSADRQDSLNPSRIGSTSLSVGRTTYSEVNRNPVASSQVRTFALETYRSAFGSGKYDSVWSGRSSLSAPTEKLNSIAFGRVEPESSRQLDVLANLLAPQRAGILPSSVSLDLASNSSFRYKYSSDRGAMFDNYPASRPELPRTDFTRDNLPRTDLSRQSLSRPDPFSRSMYSRR